MEQDYYDDRDDYGNDGRTAAANREAKRPPRKQGKGAGKYGTGEGGDKPHSGRTWPPRSKYRIRPW